MSEPRAARSGAVHGPCDSVTSPGRRGSVHSAEERPGDSPFLEGGPSKRHAPPELPPSREARACGRPALRYRILLVVADAGLAEAFFLTALLMARSVGLQTGMAGEPSRTWALFLAVLFPLIVSSRGLYRLQRFPSWRGQAAAGGRAVAWSIAVSMAAVFLFAREIPWSLRVVLTFYHAMLIAWMVALRPLLTVLIRRAGAWEARELERVLIVGYDGHARKMARAFSRGPEKMEVIGFADWASSSRVTQRIRTSPLLGTTLEEIPGLAERTRADLVVLARPDLPREQVVRLSDALLARGIRVRVAGNVFNQLIDSMPFERVGGVSLVPVGQKPLNAAAERLKRAFDLLGAGVGGVLILPLLLLIALLVKLSSPGSVLYKQTRIGRGGQPFTFFKFRSMRVENDDTAHRQYVRQFVENGDAAAIEINGQKVYKLVDDHRITPVGRFLRRTSLDELPQLLNVLRGEMSLVGPRPCLSFEYDLYKEWQKRRLMVTPGMTGLWQVTGRSYVTFEDMVLLDLFYIANWSFWMDLQLLLRTVPVVIWGKGGL